MAIWTTTGVQAASLDNLLTLFRNRFRDRFGPEVSLEPETPQGQLAALFAQALAEHEEAVVEQSNSLSVQHAVGRQLDDLGSLIGLARRTGESDADFRTRYAQSTSRLASGSVPAISSALADAGVSQSVVRENATAAAVTVQGVELRPHSVLCICEGGSDAAIAAAIRRSKPAGVDTSGDSLQDGYRFTRVERVPVRVSVSIRRDASSAAFPATGVTDIREALVAYAAREFRIGESVNSTILLSPVNTVPGHVPNVPSILLADGSPLPGVPALNTLYTLSPDDVLVTVQT